MPRHDQRVSVERLLSYEERMIVSILVEHLNILRAQVGLPPLTAPDIRHEAREYVRAHPRGEAHP